MDAVASVARPRRHRPWPTATLLAVVVGVAVGALTFVGQRFLPGQWNTLVNSGAIWLVPVFVVGSRTRSLPWAAAAGVATLLATLAGYYVLYTLAGTPKSLFYVALWVGVALIAGPLFGVAGCAWRSDRRRRRVVGLAMLGGVLAAEGLYLVIVLGYLWSGWSLVVAGVVAVVVLSSRGDRLLTLAVSPLPIAAAGLVYAAINWLGTFNSL
jgi:hypothetical protein